MDKELQADELKTEDEIKQQALIDNTAQGIFNRLKEIENKREVYDKQWVWELLQNALDAAPEDRKIEVEISLHHSQLTFTHNGRPFKSEEVAHLIYHGTTKRKQDIGKFGTGFLTTHLLSKQVNVTGFRGDNKQFKFTLERNGISSDDIKMGMEETWKQYKDSLQEIEKPPDFVVKFEYPLDDSSSNTVKIGINELSTIAPYVLAFNNKLGTIKITEELQNIRFELISEHNEIDYITKVVREEKDQKSIINHEFKMLETHEVQIAVKGEKQQDGTYRVEILKDLPKIFLAFPLLGTKDLPFPAVVNSKKFEPTEKRDGIFLGREDTDDIKQNKSLLEIASGLFIKLISDSDSSAWDNVHHLLTLDTPPNKDWLDDAWYIDLLKELISQIMNLQVLKIENSNLISFTEALIPTVDSFGELELGELWDLCYCFTSYKDRIPAKTLAPEWAKIMSGWESLGLDLTDRKITIKKIVSEIESCGELQDLRRKLDGEKNELMVLNDFYRLLLAVERREFFDNNNILPDQNRNFRKKAELFRDEGIDEALKNVSGRLEIDVRDELLNSGVSNDVQILLQAKRQNDILNLLVSKIKPPALENDQYLQANVDLFKWLLENDEFEYFEGYPILSSKENTFTQLSKKEKVLAPRDAWNETARSYADLFPQELVISDSYYEKIPQEEKWDKLNNEGLILCDPLYNEKAKISSEDLDYFLPSDEKLDEEKDHVMSSDVRLSKLFSLETKDKGIIDTIRRSKEKTRKFLGFLFDYVIEQDPQWGILIEVACECGLKHKIYPASWMATLKKRAWVPRRKGKGERPSAQYLSSVLEGHVELLQNCRKDKPSKFLNILNVSIGELMMHIVAKNEEVKLELDRAMGSLYSTFMTKPEQLSKIAQLAESDPESFAKEIEERMQTREQIQRNQTIGSIVENLLRNALERVGFKVERKRIGSDFLIEHDFITGNMETIFEVKKEEKAWFYIEVKSTSQDVVRMSLSQAKLAKEKSDNYILCVVELDDSGSELDEENITDVARFVGDIGEKIRDKVDKAESLKGEQEKTIVKGDIEIEISEGPIRFKINRRVWDGTKTLEEFIASLGDGAK